MSSWQIALNTTNLESKISVENTNEIKVLEQKTIVPPRNWINLELMVTSFWKLSSAKKYNFLSFRNSLPKELWPKEKKIFLYKNEQKLSNGVYGDTTLAIRLLRYCFVNNLLLLPGYWNKLENLVQSFSFAFIARNEKLVQCSKFKTDKLKTFCIKSTKKISFYDPRAMISDKFNFFWRKNGNPRLGKDCKKTELFYILWDHPTNIIFNKTTVTPVPRKKIC